MIIDLTGRRAVISGSTGGIGRAIAEGLAKAGAAVTINGRGEERVATALSEMRAAIPDAKLDGIAADLATRDGVSALSVWPRTPTFSSTTLAPRFPRRSRT